MQNRRIKTRRKDYTGEKIGHLTVIEMLYGYGNSGESYVRCICECGNECIKPTYRILHSINPAHCGCMEKYYKTIQANGLRKDLTGRRFGRLVVTKMICEPNQMSKAECICDCGNTVIKPITYLTTGDTQSCGCLQKERASKALTKDFSGVTSMYGVKFLRREYKNTKGTWMWLCQCGKCGTQFVALPASVLNGKIKSCGCIRRSSGETRIANLLNSLGLDSIEELPFLNDIIGANQRFDFFLPEYNAAIEYQGEQHFSPIVPFGGQDEYARRIELDKGKREFCRINNIPLIEIDYNNTEDQIKK